MYTIHTTLASLCTYNHVQLPLCITNRTTHLATEHALIIVHHLCVHILISFPAELDLCTLTQQKHACQGILCIALHCLCRCATPTSPQVTSGTPTSISCCCRSTSLLDEGARGCKRIQDPGRMSARLHLAEEAGRLPDSPDMASGVCTMIKRHLSSCRCYKFKGLAQMVASARHAKAHCTIWPLLHGMPPVYVSFQNQC